MSGFMRRRAFRPYRKGIPPILLPVFVALVLCAAFFKLVSSELRPVIETVAVSRATNLISMKIGSAVDDCLLETEMTYADFITMEVNETGGIASLSGRPAETSRFKRQVIETITGQLNCVSSEELDIPIGNLTGSIFLSGLGPEIRVEVYTIGEVTATYRNSFVAAGVNQTHHGVYLDIVATVHLLIPGEIIPVTVSEQICVAETVILGAVPDTYIHMEKGAD